MSLLVATEATRPAVGTIVDGHEQVVYLRNGDGIRRPNKARDCDLHPGRWPANRHRPLARLRQDKLSASATVVRYSMWASADSKPSPMVSNEIWVPPASRQASTSALTVVHATSGERDPVGPEAIHRPAEAAQAFAQPVPGIHRLVDAADRRR